MSEELKACPFCGGRSHHILGARQIRMLDVVKCLDCFAEIQGTYEPESALSKWNTRAQLPSLGGEAVEVVCITQGGCNVTWTATKELTPAGTALMSVRQHQRILAAATHPADQVSENVNALSATALRRAARFLESIDNGCNEVKTLRSLLAKSEGVKP